MLLLATAAGLATACRLLAGPPERIIALELEGPTRDSVTAGDTLHLHARALAANGDSAPGAVITWAILDTGTVGIVLVDSVGGVAGQLTGTWHVQAAVDSLRSDPIAIVVRPGPAARLTLGGLADSIPAGTATTDTVTALDAFGNVARGYAGTVHFTSSDTTATLPADYTFTAPDTTAAAADAGMHVFAPGVTLRTTGPQRITVRDLADSTLSKIRDVTVIP
jgi:hypothetical protein